MSSSLLDHCRSVLENFRSLSSTQRHTFVAAFLGWTMDSLDFFILVFCVPAIAKEFHTAASEVLGAVFLTQAFRPFGRSEEHTSELQSP